MKGTILMLAICVPAIFTLLTMTYLRTILRTVLAEICGTNERAEFWIRCATILSLFGALILVLAFGPTNNEVDMIDVVRRVLLWTLAGGFFGISWIARTIWNSLMKCPETRARLFDPAQIN